MTFFLQRLAERAMGHRTGARLPRTSYLSHSLTVAEQNASILSTLSISQHNQEAPTVAPSQALRAPSEGVAEAPSPLAGQSLANGVGLVAEPVGEELWAVNFLAAPERNSFHPTVFDERSLPSVLPTSLAPGEETLVSRDIHRSGPESKNDVRGRSSHRNQGDALQKPADAHALTSLVEQTPWLPVVSKAPWSPGPGMEADEKSQECPGEERFMPVRRREGQGGDPRVDNLRGIPGEIEPLLPLSRPVRDATQALVTLPSTAGEGSSAATGERNEIHITIGRVEVTALPPDEGMKPTKQPTRRRPPTSLDEYLVKRHGRAS